MKETAKAKVGYEAYAALGPGRSLSKVHRHLTANVPDGWGGVPSLRTIKEWSRQHHWSDRVCEFDVKVVQRVQEQAVENEVAERVDVLVGANTFLNKCEKIIGAFNTDEILNNLRTPQEFRALAAAFAEVAKLRELIEGSPTERVERPTLEETVARRRQLEKQIAEMDEPRLRVVGS